jgi:hypothetical protein
MVCSRLFKHLNIDLEEFKPCMIIYLDVPYSDKAKAKEFGALWDAKQKNGI